MENESVPVISNPPSSADYQALVDRTNAAINSREAGEIDARTLRERIDEINEQCRTLHLLRKLHTMRQRLAAQEEKASATRPKMT